MQKIDFALSEKNTEPAPEKTIRRRVLARRTTSYSEAPPVVKTVAARTDPFILASDLPRLIDTYIEDCAIAKHSVRSIGTKRERLGKLLWFVRNRELEEVGLREIRQFFAYMNDAHLAPWGRWGDESTTKIHAFNKQPLSPGRVKAYHSAIRAFFNYLVKDGIITASPMEKIKPPVDRPDQVQPFSEDQVTALYEAAGKTAYPARDRAILLLLIDTGMRVSELLALTHDDLDYKIGGDTAGKVFVREGKGGKERVIPFQATTKRAIYEHQSQLGEVQPGDHVFVSERGVAIGAALTPRGVAKLFERLGKAANIRGVRCSPHTCRHTFAVMFLRRGGQTFSLQQMLGHESLTMTMRYVRLAQADIAAQHRDFSPVDGLKLGRSLKRK